MSKISYNREDLIFICQKAIVPVEDWWNRDSPEAQIQIGKCWALLKAGCPFVILTEGGLSSYDNTIWVEIEHPDFSTFVTGSRPVNETFYLPTPKRLKERKGQDWY